MKITQEDKLAAVRVALAQLLECCVDDYDAMRFASALRVAAQSVADDVSYDNLTTRPLAQQLAAVLEKMSNY